MLQWLIVLSIRGLVWDLWNVAHIARHEVAPEEVEEVCHGDYIIREGYGGRVILVGPTGTGRMLTVILAPKGPGEFHPVTAYPASRRMRQRYQQEKEGDGA